MADWQVLSKANPDYAVRVGNCTNEHAVSVVASLRDDPRNPDDVYLAPADFTPPKRSWWRFW